MGGARGPVRKRELSVPEAALLSQKSVDTIYRWIRSGRLPAVETSGGLLVRKDLLLEVSSGVRPGRPREGSAGSPARGGVVTGVCDGDAAELRAELIEVLHAASYRELLEVRLAVERLSDAVEDEVSTGRPHWSPAEAGHVVYYLRWADRVKIGTTKNLRNRTRQIYFDEVLAAEPGGRNLERARHREFAALKIPEYREWFRADPGLLSHAAALRSEHGAPFKVGKS